MYYLVTAKNCSLFYNKNRRLGKNYLNNTYLIDFMEVIGIDVGGTNTRIALVEIKKRPKIIKEKTYLTNEVKRISSLINSFKKKPQAIGIGFAGPIISHKAKLTNADLKIDTKEIKKNTNVEKIYLMNDFYANGVGSKYIKKSDEIIINEGKGFKNNVSIVVGAGTGLGKSLIIDGNVYPCEPGGTTLTIENIDDYALFDFLKIKYRRMPIYEDVLSGNGLLDIYEHLEIKSNLKTNIKIRRLIKKEPFYKAKVITKYSSNNELCDLTLQIFTKFYARFIRDTCLNLLSSKVYLVGGISVAIKPYLKKYFMEEFLNNQRYAKLLNKVHISLIKNLDIGIIGAGAVAGGLSK